MKTSVLAALAAAAAFASAHGQQGPSDPQIAHIVVTAHQVDIDAGKLAQKKGSTQDVRDFGKQMVADRPGSTLSSRPACQRRHTAVNQQATALAAKLKVKPEGNDTSTSLRKGGEANLDKLGKLKGKAFDRAYVDQEVAYHQAVIDAVDKTLLPSAKNAELKALIEKVRPALVQHLEHARHLQAQLAR